MKKVVRLILGLVFLLGQLNGFGYSAEINLAADKSVIDGTITKIHDTKADFEGSGVNIHKGFGYGTIHGTGFPPTKINPVTGPEISPTESDPAALWHMNNNWQDAKGTSHGTGYGGVGFTTSSRLGSGAGSFDGRDDYVDCGSGTSLNFGTGAFSVELWIKRGGGLGVDQTIISKDPGIPGWWVAFTPGNNIRFGTRVPYNSNHMDSTVTISDTTSWHHIVVTRSGDGLKNIYVNGVLDPSSSTHAVDVNSTANLRIGDIADVQRFNGLIDEVAVYNRALTPEEIRQHYEAGSPKDASFYRSPRFDLGVKTKPTEMIISATTSSGTDLKVYARSGSSLTLDTDNISEDVLRDTSKADFDQGTGSGWITTAKGELMNADVDKFNSDIWTHNDPSHIWVDTTAGKMKLAVDRTSELRNSYRAKTFSGDFTFEHRIKITSSGASAGVAAGVGKDPSVGLEGQTDSFLSWTHSSEADQIKIMFGYKVSGTGARLGSLPDFDASLNTEYILVYNRTGDTLTGQIWDSTKTTKLFERSGTPASLGTFSYFMVSNIPNPTPLGTIYGEIDDWAEIFHSTTFNSSVIDLSSNYHLDAIALQTDIPSGTSFSLSVQVRSAATEVGLSTAAWTSPQSLTETGNNKINLISINNQSCEGGATSCAQKNQWWQYKINGTTGGNNTWVVRDVFLIPQPSGYFRLKRIDHNSSEAQNVEDNRYFQYLVLGASDGSAVWELNKIDLASRFSALDLGKCYQVASLSMADSDSADKLYRLHTTIANTSDYTSILDSQWEDSGVGNTSASISKDFAPSGKALRWLRVNRINNNNPGTSETTKAVAQLAAQPGGETTGIYHLRSQDNNFASAIPKTSTGTGTGNESYYAITIDNVVVGGISPPKEFRIYAGSNNLEKLTIKTAKYEANDGVDYCQLSWDKTTWKTSLDSQSSGLNPEDSNYPADPILANGFRSFYVRTAVPAGKPAGEGRKVRLFFEVRRP